MKKDPIYKYIVGITRPEGPYYLKVRDPILDNDIPDRYRYISTKEKKNAHKFDTKDIAILAYNVWHSKDNPLEIPLIEQIKEEE